MIRLASLLLFGLVQLAPRLAAADEPAALDDRNPVRAELLADVSQAGLGEEFRVGVMLSMAPGWHVYWTYPGNTGKPTRVEFDTDERHTKVLEPVFPYPEVFDPEPIVDLSFGYQGKVLIVATAMVFDAPPEGRTRIAAEVSWLACKQACVTGRARPKLSLAAGEQARPSDQAGLFEQVEQRLPRSLGPEAVRFETLQYEKGHFVARLRISGIGAPSGFVPSWIPGAVCKIDGYRLIGDDPAGPLAEIKLHGDNCLPGLGGLVLAPGADAQPGAGPRPHALTAWAPSDESPAAAGPADAQMPSVVTEAESLWLMLLFALLGGLLLNVMPCVIPVVIPKLLHVVRTAQKAENPAERRRLLWTNALAYAAGVIATMLALAGLVVALKRVGLEVGWGFQFQNPWFLVFMISLLLVLGLGMLHVFPLQRTRHANDLKQLRKTRRKSPLLESFLTGLLVTFLGTPCTAPLLGPALGYAFTESDLTIVAFLATVGLGLSMPFLLLGAWTGWTRVLPTRVTERYDRIMRGMAFLLFGTAVWLLSVVANAYGAEAASEVTWFALALGAGAWLYGLLALESDDLRRRLLKLLPLVGLVAAFGWWVLGFEAADLDRPQALQSPVGIRWQAFDPAELARLRSSGKTVFVDFTAEWCMNCKANERLVIETEHTRRLLEKLDVVAIKADHTRRDPIIQAWLRRYGRAGVPMYLIFPACSRDDQALLLPEILTDSRLHGALEQAGPSRAGCD